MPRVPRPLVLALLLAACEGAPVDPPLPTVEPGPGRASVLTGGDTHATDFGADAVGSLPAGWTPVWDPTPHFAVAAEAGAAGGQVLQWSATGQSRNRWGLAYGGVAQAGDQSVYTEFRVRSLGGGTSVYYMGAAAVRMGGTADDEHGYAVFFVVVPSSGARAIVLSTWTGGAYTQLGSWTTDWAMDEWYSVRLEAVGTTIRARIWPRGTAEPATWPLSATDSRHATGLPGVSHHDNGTVQWDVWETATAAPAPPPPPPPPPPAGTAVAVDFAGGAAWAPPAGWTETSAPAGAEWTVAADLSVPDGRAARSVTTATGRHILRHDAVPDTARDQEVLVRMRMADGDSRGPGVALRHSMNGTRETAYVAYFRPGIDQVEVNRFLDGGWAFVASAPFPNDPGVWYWMRFRAEGSTLLLRVWADGQPEPAGWTRTATDGGIAAGSAGLYTYEPNVVDYDLFAWAGGGATAPSPVQGPAAQVTSLVVSPAAVSLAAWTAQTFAAYGRTSGGDSVQVPVTWTATGGSVDAGGTYVAGGTPGSFGVAAWHQSVADTAEVTVTAAGPAPAGVATGFAGDAAGTQPAGWTETSAPAGAGWTVEDDASAADGRVLRAAVATTGRHVLRADSLPANATAQEVLAKLRMGDGDSRGPGVALRHSMNGTRETAYVAYFRPGTDAVEVNRFMDGAWSFVSVASFANDPGAWYWIRFRAEGSTLSVRVWADGQPEPAAWRIVATDAGIAAGGVGAYAYEPNTVDFDWFAAVAGPGSAPGP